MEESVFAIYERILKSDSGLVITKDKGYLLESRLLPIAKEASCADLKELAHKIEQPSGRELRKSVVEAMTTNETSFFRDTRPFDNLRDVILPFFIKKRSTTKRLRIWSAACSSGQEPYSIAMIIREMADKLAGWNIEIIATDLSEEILDKAKKAEYTQFEVQRGLPVQMLVKYFEQHGDKWCVKDDIRRMINFQPLNLLGDYSAMGSFDIIFCRNVLIYFDPEDKAKILNKIHRVLNKDGVLLLGGAETVIGLDVEFKGIDSHRGMYMPKDGVFLQEDAMDTSHLTSIA